MSIRTREECGCVLAAEVLEQSGTVRVRVSGQSMLPTLWPGDILTIQSKQLAQAQVGELVLYERDGRFFVHRLLCKSPTGDFFLTRGDCMSEPDEVVAGQKFLGSVCLVTRGDSQHVPQPRMSKASRAAAFALRKSGILQRAALRLCALFRYQEKPFPRLRELRNGIE